MTTDVDDDADDAVDDPPESGKGPRRELKTVYEDDTLKIVEAEAPVPGFDAVVVFTGVGHRAGAIQMDEFVGTATTSGRAALFITDKARSWFNEPGLYERVIREVAPRLASAPRVLTTGNSMGASGALLFASPLGARAALAFGPQCSVSQRIIPKERRWRPYVDPIAEFRFEDLNDFLADVIHYYVLHGTSGRDKHQSTAFRARPNLRRFAFPEKRHNLTRGLKQAGQLAPLFEAALDADDATINRILVDQGAIRPPDDPQP